MTDLAALLVTPSSTRDGVVVIAELADGSRYGFASVEDVFERETLWKRSSALGQRG
jgi:hypothetical protein